MISARRFASVLSQEVFYRSSRKEGAARGFLFFASKRKGKTFSPPSIVKSNIYSAIFNSLLSLVICFPSLFATPAEVPQPYLIVFSGLIILGAFIYIITTASFTATFASERLAELLYLFPIDEQTATKVYVYSLLLYGGGLASIFLYLPAALLMLYLAFTRGFSPILPVLGFFAGVLAILFCFLVGIAVGSYAEYIKRRGILRALSTALWLIIFLAFYSSYYLVHSLAPHLQSLTRYLPFIPFIGLLAAPIDLRASLISGSITVALLAGAGLLAISKVKVLLRLAPTPPLPTTRTLTPLAKVALTIRTPMISFVYKDLRLLVREPRRLANILLFFVLPIIIFGYQMFSHKPTSPDIFGLALAVGISAMAGALGGLSVENLFFVEKEQARVLYFTPVSRRELSFAKALACSILSSIMAPVIFAIFYLMSADLLLSLAAVLLMIVVCFSFALLESSIIVEGLPRAPSSWSEYSLPKGKMLVVRIAVMLYAIFISMGMPFAFAFFSVPLAWYASMAVIAALSLAVALPVHMGYAKKKPL